MDKACEQQNEYRKNPRTNFVISQEEKDYFDIQQRDGRKI
jgi:hypothetical protein